MPNATLPTLTARRAPRRLALLATCAALIATACGGGGTPTPAPQTAQPTATATPEAVHDLLAGVRVSSSDLQAAAAAGNALTVDLLKNLAAAHPGGNVVDSAYSLATALAMLELGARGATESQIATVLHSAGITAEQQAAAWKEFDASLLATAKADDISLSVANAIWLQKGLPFNQSFLQTLVNNFAAPSSQTDFAGDPQGAADTINHWVSDATHGMIPQIVSADSVHGLHFAIVDAIYFDAKWNQQFIPEYTSKGSFVRSDGTSVSADFMHAEMWKLPAYIGGGVTALEMPYVGNHYVADLIMPTSQPIASFVAGLTPDALAGIETKLVSTGNLKLAVPKFDIASQIDLIPVLKALGMTDAFVAGTADFSGIDGQHDLFIGLATQRARMQVDEVGTTAAAATVLGGLGGAGVPPPMLKVTFDHPFLFVIRDTKSGAIIFTAQVGDPTASS